jgi:Mce-associated membrane protein
MAKDVESPAENDDGDDAGESAIGAATQASPRSGVRPALAAGAVVVVALSGLVGWLGYRTYESHEAEQQRQLFLRVARQSAVDVTTIKHTEVEADVQHILDSSTGSFYDDFSKRKQPFIELIKRERSTSQGTITEAGLLSVTGDSARALVALSVKLSKGGAPEAKLEGFRLRIDMRRAGNGAKVSDLEYVQ